MSHRNLFATSFQKSQRYKFRSTSNNVIYPKELVPGSNRIYRGHFQNTQNCKTFFDKIMAVGNLIFYKVQTIPCNYVLAKVNTHLTGIYGDTEGQSFKIRHVTYSFWLIRHLWNSSIQLFWWLCWKKTKQSDAWNCRRYLFTNLACLFVGATWTISVHTSNDVLIIL